VQQAHPHAGTTNQGRAQFLQDGKSTAPHHGTLLKSYPGDGGSRALKTPHPFLLTIMHSSGHGVLANTSEVCSCALGQQHLRVVVSSVPCSGYYGLVSSILASICSQVERTLPEGDAQAK
jgi:hypothetical protein